MSAVALESWFPGARGQLQKQRNKSVCFSDNRKQQEDGSQSTPTCLSGFTPTDPPLDPARNFVDPLVRPNMLNYGSTAMNMSGAVSLGCSADPTIRISNLHDQVSDEDDNSCGGHNIGIAPSQLPPPLFKDSSVNNLPSPRRTIFGATISKVLQNQRTSAWAQDLSPESTFFSNRRQERERLCLKDAHYHQNGDNMSNRRQNSGLSTLARESGPCLYQIDASPTHDQARILSGLTPPGSPISESQRMCKYSASLSGPPSLHLAATSSSTPATIWSSIFLRNDRNDHDRTLPPMPPRREGSLQQEVLPILGMRPPHRGHKHRYHQPQQVHESVHAQSLLLGIAFCAIWSPNNLMAPNLTEIALTFAMQTTKERDLYLGSYCALATSVLSLPLAAGIGFFADVTSSRRDLFVVTIFGGALATLGTIYATTYSQLLLSRFATGAFMSGSVPIVFSFLGDMFAPEKRNAASSGLTACMGVGIFLGQVYAGTHSSNWRRAFWGSTIFQFISAVLCAVLIQEPVRGSQERALQEMLKAGRHYDRKLTWDAFRHAVQNNASNLNLLLQGFFSNLPWGVIFVFLNDYLSQERGFSVPDATFLVLIFGVGSAFGGVLGGYLGESVQAFNRAYLPLFMALTTAAGILPFYRLLNSQFDNAHGLQAFFWAGSAGLVAALPSVNTRPCMINVNPPETRGASLTTANLFIQLGRGLGPSCITLLRSMFGMNRKIAFNLTVRGRLVGVMASEVSFRVTL